MKYTKNQILALFFGILLVFIFQKQINLNKLKYFLSVFLIIFILSPAAYLYDSISKTDKRTDYYGKKIALEVEKKWNKKYKSKIIMVYGDEWSAGNLSYHLQSRPRWIVGSHKRLVCDESFNCMSYK